MSQTPCREFFAAVAVLLTSIACLPDDTRAPPGELVVTVSADEALSARVANTEDGWAISYSRYLVLLGAAEIGGGDCDAYSEANYSRIFELNEPSPQRVSLLYGLGHCQFSFRVGPPAWDTVLGAGVSKEDEILLRTPGSDAHATDSGISVQIEGTARRLGVEKSFLWSFRRYIEYNDCALSRDDPQSGGVVLSAHQLTEVDIEIRSAAMFQNTPMEPEAPARFEPFRAADDEHGDADGTITLEELHGSPLPPGAVANGLIQNLGDRVYLQLLSQIARFRGTGSCQIRSASSRPDFGGP